MIINILTINKKIQVELNKDDTIAHLKELIRNKESIPIECQPLTFKGVLLENNRILSDYNIESNSLIYFKINNKIVFDEEKISKFINLLQSNESLI